MELRIVEDRTNPLLKRHELRFEVDHATAATPTRDTVRTELAKAVHAAKDRVIIERMKPRFGTAVTRGEANVYDTAEAAKTITREHILVRNGLKEKESKAPGAPAEPAKPEAPAIAPPPAEPAAAPAAPAAPAPAEPKPAAHPPKSPPKHAASEKSEETPKHPEPATSPAPSEPAKRPKAHPKKE
jgi:small subunit ribosomal protein S24e